MLKLKPFVFLLLIIMVFMSCQKKEEYNSTTLRLNFQEGDLPSLHPYQLMIYLRGISIGKTLYEGLTRLDKDGKPNLAGAESIDISSDGLKYTVSLRENFWSNGKKVVAEDYAKAWIEALSPSSNCPRADLLYVIKNGEKAKKGLIKKEEIGVKVADDKTLLIELDYPSPYFLELLAQPICAPLADVTLNEPKVFNGPFQVDVWQHGHLLRLKQNPHYWANSDISLNLIDIYMVQDVMTAFTMFEKGEIDWVGVPFVPLSTELIDHLRKEHMLQSHPVNRAFWIFLNTETPFLSSPFIRQALNLSFDRKVPTEHIFSIGYPLTKPLPTALLPVEPSFPVEENLKIANQLMDLGLKELNFTRKDLKPLVITYSQQAGRKQFAEYLQQAWSQGLNIPVTIEPQEWNIFRVNLGSGNYQVSGSFEAAFYNDPLELLQKFVEKGPNNFPQWENEEFKEIVQNAKQEKDPATRLQLLADAEQILMEEVPFIPAFSDEFVFAHRPGLKGYVFDFVGACDVSRVSLE